jgi:hypothetical protein
MTVQKFSYSCLFILRKTTSAMLLGFLLAPVHFSWAQDEFEEEPDINEKFPSYFGIQVRTLFPTQFIGQSELTLGKDGFSTTLQQSLGYSFGGTVRAGLTKLLAFETGINYTQREFNVTMEVPDSNIYATNHLTFISYDIPINGLVYIQMGKQTFMNASLGLALTFKPTDVGILTKPGGSNLFYHTGFVKRKAGFDINANIGFEYRTKKSGFFYLGGSGRVPLAPLFQLIAQYKYQGIKNTVSGNVDGSYLSIDVKYFFPNIRNRGVQFTHGPIL